MTSNMARITRLQRELGRRTHLSDDEQHSRWAQFSRNERHGVVAPGDLAGCAHIAEYYQRMVMPTDLLRANVDAGHPPRLNEYETWCARLLMVPPGQRVPDFLLTAFETEFEDAWRPRTRPATTWRPDLRLYTESVRRFITHALGTPDAARLRHRIAAGELDGPPTYPDRWNFLRNYHYYVRFDMPHFPNVGWNGEIHEPALGDVIIRAEEAGGAWNSDLKDSDDLRHLIV